MNTSRRFPSLMLLGALAAISATPSNGIDAQSPTPPRPPYSPFKTIYVNDSCRLLPSPAKRTAAKKPRLTSDPVICHIESVANSRHMEERQVGAELQRSEVTVSEQTYVLQNITPDPVIFQVEHFVPLGWAVDSDPAPDAMENSVAIFHPQVQPGETVRLHVGLRRTKPLRSKILKSAIHASTNPNGD